MTIAAERALVSKYCVGCHNDKLKSGGFSWTRIGLSHPEQNAEQIEKVIRKLRVGLMPPRDYRVLKRPRLKDLPLRLR